MVSISSKSEVFDFSGGPKKPLNLPYLVANAYGFNFFKIGSIWIFVGEKPPWWGGGTFDLRCPFSNADELFQSKVMCENLVQIGWNWRYVNFERGKKSPIRGGVTCDLQCPSSNLAELFRSKVICENLVRIGWAFQELSCPHTNKQTYKHTYIPTYKHPKKKKNHRRNWKQFPSEKFFSGRIIITDATEKNTFGKILFWAVIIIKLIIMLRNYTQQGMIVYIF